MVTESPIDVVTDIRLKPLRLPFFILSGLTAGVTFAGLPYLWGRALLMVAMPAADGLRPTFPELRYTATLLVAVAMCILLSSLTALVRPNRASLGWLLVGVTAVWVTTHAILIAVSATGTSPLQALVPLFVFASLWLLWLAWMPAWPVPWLLRGGVLVMLLAGPVLFIMLFQLIGLRGNGFNTEFAWRHGARWTLGDEDADDELVAEADLATTTEFDYPQFLGPWRQAYAKDYEVYVDGRAKERPLEKDWKEKPPCELWRQPIGAGWGSFAVVGDYAVTQEQRGEYECVTCIKVKDGSLMWRHRDRARFRSNLGGIGPRATPTIVDGRVYTVGATGILNCLDGATGKPIWPAVNILEDNDARNIEHGVAASPLVYGDFVVVCPTGKGGPSLVAYDRATGERVWAQGTDQASYSSPIWAEINGVNQVLLFTSTSIVGHDAKTGEVLWSYPWENNQRINSAQPIANAGINGQVFISTGYGKGCALLKLILSKDGSWDVELIWEDRRLMQTKFSTPIELWGFIYGLDDGVLECVEISSGDRRWRDGRYGHGQILKCWGLSHGQSQAKPVPELLIVQAEDGSVHLVRMTHARLTELGSVPGLADKTWNHPALAGRHLLIRNDKEAMCYELPVVEEDY